MPNNTPSWNRLKKDPDFYKKYKLNTNPAKGRTYLPINNKEHKQEDGDIPPYEEEETDDCFT